MAEFLGRRSGILSPESRAKMLAEQKFIDENRESLNREGLAHKAELDAMIEAFVMLKAERERRGLSLNDIAERSGIDKSRLSKLENDPYPNPTLSTLMRIADAIGVRLTLGMVDKDAA